MSKHSHHRTIVAHSKNRPPAVTPEDMRNKFVRPALMQIGLLDDYSEMLLMGTAAIESHFIYTTQMPQGPGRGYWQMELTTHTDLWDRVLAKKSNADVAEKIILLLDGQAPRNELCITNHLYAAAMARVKYLSCPSATPLNLKGQAHYWKIYYNGNSAHGRTEADYLKVWKELCAGVYPDFK